MYWVSLGLIGSGANRRDACWEVVSGRGWAKQDCAGPVGIYKQDCEYKCICGGVLFWGYGGYKKNNTTLLRDVARRITMSILNWQLLYFILRRLRQILEHLALDRFLVVFRRSEGYLYQKCLCGALTRR